MPIALVIVAVVILLMLLAFAVTRINLVVWQRSRLERKFRKLGMSEHTESLGHATVRFWLGPDTGPDLLLAHGFGASAIWQWHPHVQALAEHYRIIMPDLLWFGGSYSDDLDYSVDHQVEVLRRLLAKLGVDGCHVVGISYGGFVAYELAATEPERVRKLVLIDSPGRAYAIDDYRELCQRFEIEHIETLMLPTEPEGIRTLMHVASRHPPYAPRWVLRQALKELYSENREHQKGLIRAMLDQVPAVASRDGQLRAPTLIFWGSHDPIFPVELAHRLKLQLGETARLEIIEDASHAPNLEYPKQTNELLLGFLVE